MHVTYVIGNLGRDPELKKFDNGGCVVNFSVGVTERGRKLDNGTEIAPHTEWYRCVAKNKLAEIIAQYCKKGHKVHITCRKHTREYTDKDNVKKSIEEYIVSDLEMLTPKEHRNDPAPVGEPAIPPVQEQFTEKNDELPF